MKKYVFNNRKKTERKEQKQNKQQQHETGQMDSLQNTTNLT